MRYKEKKIWACGKDSISENTNWRETTSYVSLPSEIPERTKAETSCGQK